MEESVDVHSHRFDRDQPFEDIGIKTGGTPHPSLFGSASAVFSDCML